MSRDTLARFASARYLGVKVFWLLTVGRSLTQLEYFQGMEAAPWQSQQIGVEGFSRLTY